MAATRSRINKMAVEHSKMSFEEAYQLCNAKRLEIKLRLVEISVSSVKRCFADKVEVAGNKRIRESAINKKTMESMIEAEEKTAHFF